MADSTERDLRMWIGLKNDNKPELVFDKHYALKCPHCAVQSNVSAVSIPRYEYLQRFEPKRVGVVYRCDSCNEPITLVFRTQLDFGNMRVLFSDQFEQVQRSQESFDFDHLPEPVRADFRDALTCYSATGSALLAIRSFGIRACMTLRSPQD